MKTILKILLIVLILIWIVPGLVGRDPWMNDEPYSFGLVNHIVKTGDWIVPTLAGEPFMEKPPLYYMTAAVFSRVLFPPFQLHDAVRLASGFYLFLTLLFVGLTARELLGNDYVVTAVLVLMGCTELLLIAHRIITDTALFTGFAAAWYGLALSKRRFAPGGFWIGTGIGIGFMSKGLLAPGVIGVTALLLPLLFQPWRKKAYCYSLLIALAASLPWFLIWPYALYRRSPNLFVEWLWVENFGRYFGFWRGGEPRSLQGLKNLELQRIAMPVAPLALWALWYYRRSWRDQPAFLQLPLTAFIVMFMILCVSANARPLYALPMLLPLAFLAAAGVHAIPDKASRIITWANIILFGSASLLLWFGWLAMLTGKPAFISQKLSLLLPGYTPSFSGIHFGAALVCTIACIFIAASLIRLSSPVMASWTVGLTLTWSLAMTLWLPGLDAKLSSRSVFTSLRESMPGQYRCMASQNLGEDDRAMLEYYTGILTRRIEVKGPGDCDLLLVQSGGEPQDPVAGPAWQMRWEGKKEKSEHPKQIYRLFERADRQPRRGRKVEKGL